MKNKLEQLLPPHLRDLVPYPPDRFVSDLARETGLPAEQILKLDSNENPLGISPIVNRALVQACASAAIYPDDGYALTLQLAKHYAVATDQIVLGDGSSEILGLVAQAFLTPGTNAIYAQYAFSIFRIVTQMRAATAICVPATAYGHDLDAMRKAMTPDTRVIFIANPNNPTGTLLEPAKLQEFFAQVPQNVLIVLDEAYWEYVPAAHRLDSVTLLTKFPNLLIVRTFSKAYALAGLRVGFALADARIARILNRVRLPVNVSSLALTAASVALTDTEFLTRSCESNAHGMQQLVQGLTKLNIQYIPSAGNFITFTVNNAAMVYKKLLAQGVITRLLTDYGLPDFIRVSIGRAEQNSRFLAVLKTICRVD